MGDFKHQGGYAIKEENLPPIKYYDDEGRITKDLFDKDAQAWADRFCKDGLKRNQLRNFYHDVKSFERKLDPFQKEKSFDENHPYLKMLKSKAYYAADRLKREKIPDSFKEFLKKNIDLVQSYKDFDTFVTFFEAVVGFYYGKETR